MELSQEKIIAFLKEHMLAVGLGMVGVICLGYGLITLLGQSKHDDSVVFESSQAESASVKSDVSSKSTKQITIDIEGAVQKPGIYKLNSDSRVHDALIAAGGMSGTADRAKIAQSLNLAAPLTDGAKLYIPFVGEQLMGSAGQSGSSGGSGQTVLGASTAMININQASESELDTLSGVGQVTAQKIISNRPYQRIEDLVEKKVVGASVFEKIKEKISVY